MRVIADDDPGMRAAKRMQILEHLLAVIERPKSINNQDDVERALQRPHEFRIFDVAYHECEIGRRPAADSAHPRTQVDSEPRLRQQARQQMAGATTELENPCALRNEKFQVVQIFGMKEARLAQPFLSLRSRFVRMTQDLALSDRNGTGRHMRCRNFGHFSLLPRESGMADIK